MDIRAINPFITGGPVPASKFIGRREQVDTILSQLANPESRGSSAISGEQRIGKTSLLYYITSPEAAMRHKLPTDQFVFVFVDAQTLGSYMDSQKIDTFNETVFWHYILRLLSIEPPASEYAKELLGQETVGVNDLTTLFDQVAGQDKLVILLLDEFEWIIDKIESQHPTLLQTLRRLIGGLSSQRGLALITSSGESLHVLCSHIRPMGSPFPNALVSVHLRPFSKSESNQLIDKYLEQNDIQFTNRDKEFAYEQSNGHPYWLQRVCVEMFNRYLEKGESNSVQGAQITMVLDDLDYEEIRNKIVMERRRDSIPSEREREEERETQPSPETEKSVWRIWWVVFLVLVLSAGIGTGIGLLFSSAFLVQLSLVLWAALVPVLIIGAALRK